MKAWKISGSILLLLFLATSALIWFRKVDGAGVIQTPQMKEVTLLLWCICAIPVVIGYLIWLGVLLKRKQKVEE